MNFYPSWRYHLNQPRKLVRSAEEDQALIGWFHSPAEFGVETCPGRTPDPVIAARLADLAPKPAPAPEEEARDDTAAIEEIEEVIHQAESKLAAIKRPSRKGK